MTKETGGVVLAFAGFVVLVGGLKGTWRNALHGLAPGVFAAAGGSSGSNGGDFGSTAGKVGSSTAAAPSGSRLPGTSVAPGGGLVPLGR